jgi:hypothetical protein
LVVTAATATFQPSTYASAASSSRSRTVTVAGGIGARSVFANEKIAGRPEQPMINVVTGKAMTPTQAVASDLADGQAGAAISAITARTLAGDALAMIPSDFRRVMGYTPAIAHLANGEAVAINPDGGCSVVGGGRPFDLDVPCKAHDLGYDLLRYAHRHGQDLGPDARRKVDGKFGRDLDTQCLASYSGTRADACELMATSFDAGVGFNSWRQGFGAPIAAAGLVRTVGMMALAGLALILVLQALTLRIARRIRIRRKLQPAPLAVRPATT